MGRHSEIESIFRQHKVYLCNCQILVVNNHVDSFYINCYCLYSKDRKEKITELNKSNAKITELNCAT